MIWFEKPIKTCESIIKGDRCIASIKMMNRVVKAQRIRGGVALCTQEDGNHSYGCTYADFGFTGRLQEVEKRR